MASASSIITCALQGGAKAVRMSAGPLLRTSTVGIRSMSSVSTGFVSPQAGPRHSDLTPAYRSCLFVPGDSEKKLKKSTGCGSDVCVLDLEDGVGHEKKAEARATLSSSFQQLTYPSGTHTMIRLNSVDARTSDGQSQLELDVDMLKQFKTLPNAVGLSKADSPQDVEFCMELLDKHLPRDMPPLGIYLMIESPLAVMQLEAICQALLNCAQEKRFLPGALLFGHMDYCTEAGIDPTPRDRSKLLYAEQRISAVARAFRLQAIDCLYTLVKDLDGLRADSQHAAQTGFTGKTVLHPMQVDIVNEEFSPSAKLVAWAQGLLDAHAAHKSSGQSVFLYDGKLVDEPIFRRAQFALAAAERRKSS